VSARAAGGQAGSGHLVRGGSSAPVRGEAMSGDTRSDLLRRVRLRRALFDYGEGSSPGVVEAPPARELIPTIMPGAEPRIELPGGRPRLLVGGDPG